jgi:hypothetical protein
MYIGTVHKAKGYLYLYNSFLHITRLHFYCVFLLPVCVNTHLASFSTTVSLTESFG